MDLFSSLRLVRGRWVVVAIMAIGGVLVGLATLWVSDGSGASHFSTTSTLTFAPPPNNAAWAFQSPEQVGVLATGGDVPVRVAEAVGETEDGLGQQIITRANASAGTLEIEVVGRGADHTARLGEAVVAELMTTVSAQEQTRFDAQRDQTALRLRQLTDDLAALDGQLTGATGTDREVLLTQRTGTLNQYWFTYEQFQLLAAQGGPTPRLSPFRAGAPVEIGREEYEDVLAAGARGENNLSLDANTQPEERSSGSTSPDGAVPRGLLGGFLGLLAGLGLVFATDRMNPRLRTRTEVEAAFAARVLAVVPRHGTKERGAGPIMVTTHPNSRAAEAYRSVRSLLLLHANAALADRNGDPRPEEGSARHGPGLVVMVASASPGEGKTTTTANLAAAFAEAGASVLAVSCDFHRPELHALLGASAEPARANTTSVAGVRCVSAVTNDPALTPPYIVGRQRELVEEARQLFDVVLLDTAPLLTTNDATELVPTVDVVVVVARAGVTTLGAAARARELLGVLGVSVPGVVLFDPYRSANDPYYDDDVARRRPPGRPTQATRAGQQAGTPGRDEPEVELASLRSGSLSP